MRRWLVGIVFLWSASVWSQAATESMKTTNEQSLQQVFAAPVLQAYQENSDVKIQELFFYLQQLTQPGLDPSLRNEMETACLALFVNEETLVVDLTSPTPTLIPIAKLLQKLAQSDPIQITVSALVKYKTVTYRSWKSGFTINCIQNERTWECVLTQVVYFQLLPQQFGANQQQTYQYRLGAMELR
ncbi:hypothetical protein [Flavobacterium sp.]|uniref:hypothetical protein n=1 Tax=Flavobacterium sp. TaxID=239 RepID=UPI00260D363A|nr:hypothetical protein [Flavobacterium sp.]